MPEVKLLENAFSEFSKASDSIISHYGILESQIKELKKELEEKNHYKDLDTLEDVEGIKKYMRSLKRKGLDRKEIVSRCNTKFEVPKKDLRTIFKQLK